MNLRTIFILLSLISWPFIIINAYRHMDNLPFAIIISFLYIIGWYDIIQKKKSILSTYPIIGHFRYILRAISPELHQYFIESNTDGMPFSKNQIELINKRSQGQDSIHPFGTEEDFYKDGVEWISHTIFPKKQLSKDPYVKVGSSTCKQPYMSSIFNISAMSFGALSENAIIALNSGAKIGGFSHNTGEGGLSPHHLQGGDIVLQLGTSNFGFRNEDGTLNEESFTQKSNLEVVKMIEIKLSQGAKPGHGGMLPAAKNTPEIAKIRMVKEHTDVLSPAFNASFNSELSLINFIDRVRTLSGFKPIGIKLCIGSKDEFISLIQAFKDKDIFPDFITIDAAEGGSGAAPIEYSNHIGMRGDDALLFVNETLINLGVREKMKIIYAGKVTSGFTLLKALCYGADLCNSARGFMFSLGCIQSLRCHTDSCPTGIATQQKSLQAGLRPSNKSNKVANYHKGTIKAFMGMTSTLGVGSLDELNKNHIHIFEKRV